ncbi:uncharacterized protein [Nicotiana sylvestris]|uniref:uncharacterized protein n=1 Tax=Nicotiana sylvestris TaxID=4096 RepID=UPI00388C86D2
MAVTTRSGRGSDVNASKQKQVMDDNVELQDDEVPLVVEDVVDENVNNGDKMKYLHGKYAHRKEFKIRDLVLLFNSRLRLFPGKLKSKWSGPFEVVFVTPFGALDLKNKTGEIFRVNGHRVKHYLGKIDDSHVVALLHFK